MAGKSAKYVIRGAAREDILRQYSYYLLDKVAPEVARQFVDSVDSAIEKICKAPGMGAPRYFVNPILVGLRSWPLTGFPAIRIYYVFSEDTVRIVRVLHGKRDIANLLESATSSEL